MFHTKLIPPVVNGYLPLFFGLTGLLLTLYSEVQNWSKGQKLKLAKQNIQRQESYSLCSFIIELVNCGNLAESISYSNDLRSSITKCKNECDSLELKSNYSKHITMLTSWLSNLHALKRGTKTVIDTDKFVDRLDELREIFNNSHD